MYTKYSLSGNYSLVVHSFGGRVAIKHFVNLNKTRTRGPNVEKLVLIGAAGIKHSHTIKQRIAYVFAKMGDAFFTLPILHYFKKAAKAALYKFMHVHDYESLSGVMKDTFLKVKDENLLPYIDQINCSTLIIWGKHDGYVPLRDAYTMQSLIPGAKLKIIPEGRHGIHRTHARKVATYIDTFLSTR